MELALPVRPSQPLKNRLFNGADQTAQITDQLTQVEVYNTISDNTNSPSNN